MHAGKRIHIPLGFTDVDADDSSFWSIWVQYRSDTSAIRISKSNEFVRAEVSLIRLVNDETPPYPIWITDDRIDWTLLDNVVEVRDPDLMSDVKKQIGLKSSQLDEQLRFWAQVLRDVAGDYLAGSFAPIDEAAALIRSRVAAHPQRVQVWLPEDAPVGPEAQEANAVQATVPANVGVSVRRYRRGRPRKSNPGERSSTGVGRIRTCRDAWWKFDTRNGEHWGYAARFRLAWAVAFWAPGPASQRADYRLRAPRRSHGACR